MLFLTLVSSQQVSLSGYEADDEVTNSATGVAANDDDDEVTSAYNPAPVSLIYHFLYYNLSLMHLFYLLLCCA